jgi:hypothetical protein
MPWARIETETPTETIVLEALPDQPPGWFRLVVRCSKAAQRETVTLDGPDSTVRVAYERL